MIPADDVCVIHMEGKRAHYVALPALDVLMAVSANPGCWLSVPRIYLPKDDEGPAVAVAAWVKVDLVETVTQAVFDSPEEGFRYHDGITAARRDRPETFKLEVVR